MLLVEWMGLDSAEAAEILGVALHPSEAASAAPRKPSENDWAPSRRACFPRISPPCCSLTRTEAASPSGSISPVVSRFQRAENRTDRTEGSHDAGRFQDVAFGPS